MHPKVQERLTEEAKAATPLAEQKWAESLRSTITMNGAGIAGVLALLQAFPSARLGLVVSALPFVAGLLFALVAWLFTYSSDQDQLKTRWKRAETVAKATFWCVGLFALGIIGALSVSLSAAWDDGSTPTQTEQPARQISN